MKLSDRMLEQIDDVIMAPISVVNMWATEVFALEQQLMKANDILRKNERVAMVAQEHKDADWEFDPEYSLDGLRTWGAVLKALKELEAE